MKINHADPRVKAQRDYFFRSRGMTDAAIAKYDALEIKAEDRPAAKDGEVLAYGPIVTKIEADIMENWFGITEMVTNEGFREALNAIEGDVMLRINSPGGDVWEASGIVTAISERRNAGGKVDGIVDGLAASAATLISSTADRVAIAELGTMMLHESWTFTYGNKRELRETADFLEKMDMQAAELYGRRMGKDATEVAAILEAETWYTAPEAIEAGLADEVIVPPAKSGKDDDNEDARMYDRRNMRLAALYAQRQAV